MLKNFLKYIATLSFLGLLGLLIFDSFVLPSITNSKNNLYLPDVKNTNVFYAEKKLLDLGFKVEIIKSKYIENTKPNTVINMSPRAFTKVKIGRVIKLTTAGEKEIIELKDYIGISLTNAKLSLKRNGILIDTIMYEYSNDIIKNHITSQYPIKGKNLFTNDKVTFVVSLGKPPNHYTVPNLINMSLSKAKQYISKSGLLLGEINYEYNENFLNNTILEQNLTPGLKLSFPEYINLTISTEIKE